MTTSKLELKDQLRAIELGRFIPRGTDLNSALEEANRILNSQRDKDIEFLKSRNFGTSLQQENVKERLSRLRDLNSKDVYEISYSQDSIQKLALTYGLRFLRVKHYKAELPIDLAQKMREYEEKKPYGHTPSYFILAPAKYFELTERPKPVTTDPLLFAEDGRGYKLIHQWGDQHISLIRKLIYLPLSTSSKPIAFLIWLSLVSMLVAFDAMIISNYHTEGSAVAPGCIFPTIMLTFVWSFLYPSLRNQYSLSWDVPYTN